MSWSAKQTFPAGVRQRGLEVAPSLHNTPPGALYRIRASAGCLWPEVFEALPSLVEVSYPKPLPEFR
jgi:hypothetical protein